MHIENTRLPFVTYLNFIYSCFLVCMVDICTFSLIHDFFCASFFVYGSSLGFPVFLRLWHLLHLHRLYSIILEGLHFWSCWRMKLGRWTIDFNSEDVKWNLVIVVLYICYIYIIYISYHRNYHRQFLVFVFRLTIRYLFGIHPTKVCLPNISFFVYHHKFHSNPDIIPLYSKPGNSQKWIEFSL